MGKEPRWFKIHRGILKPRLRNKKEKKKKEVAGRQCLSRNLQWSDHLRLIRAEWVAGIRNYLIAGDGPAE